MRYAFPCLDLPWTSGAYTSVTQNLSPAMKNFNTRPLAPEIYEKALHLSKVSKEDAVYLPGEEAHLRDKTQTPAAFVKIEEGKVGYVGGVGNTEEEQYVITRMCGLYKHLNLYRTMSAITCNRYLVP